MSFGTRWRRLWRKWAARKTRHKPLREFVYLDDVSVLSLLASRVGAVPSEYRDSESSTLRSKLTSSAGASGIVVKAGAGSETEGSHSTTSEVVRKSSVQSAFKELYEYEASALALRPSGESDNPPNIRDAAGLLREADRIKDGRWVRRADDLKRGDLIEVEVELDADEIFRFSVIVSTLLQFADDIPELAAISNGQDLRDILTANRVLERMLAGLVPLRGRAVDYCSATIDGQRLVVHRSVVDGSPADAGVTFEPLHIVGVAERDLFWKDIRRVLFSGSRYRMLCRLSRDGVQSEWTPVKLVELLKDVVPGVAANFDGRGILRDLREAQEAPELADDAPRRALAGYAKKLATYYGQTLTDADLETAVPPKHLSPPAFASVPQQREAFDAVTKAIATRFALTAEPEVAADLREEALGPQGWAANTESEPSSPTLSDETDGPLMDCEFVAIYW